MLPIARQDLQDLLTINLAFSKKYIHKRGRRSPLERSQLLKMAQAYFLKASLFERCTI